MEFSMLLFLRLVRIGMFLSAVSLLYCLKDKIFIIYVISIRYLLWQDLPYYLERYMLVYSRVLEARNIHMTFNTTLK